MDFESLQTYLMARSHWILQVFIIVLGALVIDALSRRALNRLYRRLAEGTRNPWDESLVDAARQPSSALIWVLGILFAAEIAHQATGAAIFQAIDPLRRLGVVMALTWFLVRLVRNGQAAYLASTAPGESKLDTATLDSLGKLLRVSILITASLVALQSLGFSISGVLAFGGVGGIAVGFAAKDLLANFFGGLMIYLDRPFAVGDWIRSPDRDIEGTVEEISWRLTRIRTFDKRPLYLPNATFSTIAVENPSRMSHRRIKETVGIRYDDAGKMGAIVNEVREMLRSHPDIAGDQTLFVHFNAFAPSSLDFLIYCFTRTTVWVEYHAVKEKVLLQVIGIIARHGAEIAFPTSTVHVPDGLALQGQGPAGRG